MPVPRFHVVRVLWNSSCGNSLINYHLADIAVQYNIPPGYYYYCLKRDKDAALKDRRFDLIQNKRNICHPSIYQPIIFFATLHAFGTPLNSLGGSELQNDKELAKLADNFIL